MPVWPESFYSFGINLKTAATEWKLRGKRTAPAAQAKAYAALMPKLAATGHWRKQGITPGLPYARFRTEIAPSTHAQLAPLIEKMKAGEADVLWPGKCELFAASSGTTEWQPKHFPVTEEMLRHFRRAGLEALLYYTVRVRHAGAFRGRHLLLGGATGLAPLGAGGRHRAFAGELSGIVAANLPLWAERHLYEPGTSAARAADCDDRMDAIVTRTFGADISLVAGLPHWTLALANEIRERTTEHDKPIADLQVLWPNLECFVHTGIPVAPFAAELREALGKPVTFHEVYAASEGFFAAQDLPSPQAGLRVMADLGLFFEFIPMTEFEPARLDQLGPKAVPLAEVKTGVDYAMLLTTPGGLVRTVLDDVVRFTSTEPPRLLYVGRTSLRLNTAGERVSEKDLTDALVGVCNRNQWRIVNFHVAPLASTSGLTGQRRLRHEWWVELKPGTVATPTGPQIAAMLDADLRQLNSDYADRRTKGALDEPFVRLVMPGIFEHWLRHAGKWGGQHKLPRCRPDRVLADQLAQITNFAAD